MADSTTRKPTNPGRMGEQVPQAPTNPGRMGEQVPQAPTSPGEIGKILHEISEMREEMSVLWKESDNRWKEANVRLERLEIEAEKERVASQKDSAECTKGRDDNGDDDDDSDYEEDEDSWDDDHKRWENASKWERDLTIDFEWDRQEAMLKEALWELLEEYGIQPQWVSSGVRRIDENGWTIGFDMMAANAKEAVVLYVNSEITPEYVDLFSERMERVNEIISDYADKPIYGGIAYLKKKNSEGIAMAEQRGYFVIRATGSSASIVNKEGFKPRAH